MKLQKVLGATSEIWQVFVRDSSSTTGGGLTGLVFNSASLTAYYHRDTDTTATAITLVTMTVGTFTSSGFKEIDATNMPGWYQFCPPNAALASGAKSVGIHLKGATNMAPLPIEVQLTAVNHDSATSFLTGVNGIAPPTNWNLSSIDASGRVDLGKWVGVAPNALVSGKVDATLAIRGNTAQAGAAGSITLDAGASATDNLYRGLKVVLASGTGAGQCRLISGYTGASKVATVTPNWITTPDNTSVFIVAAWNGVDVELVGLTQQTARDIGASVIAASVTGNVGGNVVGSVASVVGAVGSVTGLTAANLDVAVSTRTKPADTQAAVTTVTNLTNAPTAGDLTVAMAATVKAQAVAALSTDTYAEPAAVPAATASLAAKIGYITAKARNKITQTATTQLLRNDGDAGTIATTAVSDDGTTFIKAKDL